MKFMNVDAERLMLHTKCSYIKAIRLFLECLMKMAFTAVKMYAFEMMKLVC